MALKKITVSFPARYALQLFLKRPHSGTDVEVVAKGLEFYEKLSLAFVQKWAQDNSENNILAYSKVLEAEVDDEPIKPITVRIDETYLTWLRDRLKGHDWSKINTTNPMTGAVTVITIGIALELQVCIGALYKAINEAISGADVDG